jgi:hypothetical protein
MLLASGEEERRKMKLKPMILKKAILQDIENVIRILGKSKGILLYFCKKN